MSDNPSTLENWKAKLDDARGLLNRHIDEVRQDYARKRVKRPIYRGPEHDWYAVWFAFWAAFCEKTITFLPAPQPRIFRFIEGQDEKSVKQELIPDYGVMRVFRPRRSSPYPRRSTRSDVPTVSKRWVALQEIKPPPVTTATEEGVWDGIREAEKDLERQVQLFFAAEIPMQEAVIGICASGEWWTWDVYTKDDVKPLSKHEDGDYRTSVELPDEDDADEEPRVAYKLNTEESNTAILELRAAIQGLRGFDGFDENL
ncbi:uncharacterized protein FOMMEDRAFT_156965 [Fomitiporia mediterranea MF3/22]|uniref:uncharacterized protein n=1 Tax=Fomitiporia mediterranea (strain MF3/22) TaxID=694068 RepID=UPI00044095FD|nr:uncharacterized protein FOMMEDRAFT_156965 [Fomitiporia mediterranea MF3/22]EJD01836.1 hypothetical protein FOMMEDRAFT_156965 [Fomitiporia mediterranea MF3/22]